MSQAWGSETQEENKVEDKQQEPVWSTASVNQVDVKENEFTAQWGAPEPEKKEEGKEGGAGSQWGVGWNEPPKTHTGWDNIDVKPSYSRGKGRDGYQG